MRIYRAKLFTGPTEVKIRAAFARDDVLQVVEGTEHIYVDVRADNPVDALRIAATEAGYERPRPDLGDSVREVV